MVMGGNGSILFWSGLALTEGFLGRWCGLGTPKVSIQGAGRGIGTAFIDSVPLTGCTAPPRWPGTSKELQNGLEGGGAPHPPD